MSARPKLHMGDLAGRAKLERSLELALAHGMHEHAGRAYVNFADQALIVRDYDRVRQLIADGLAYMRDRDLDSWTMYALTERARAHLEQGLWREAEEDASAVLRAAPAAITWLVAAVVLGCVRMRRGDPGAGPLLDEARERAWAAGEIQRIGPVAAARAEAAWLEGDNQRTRDEVADAYELALRHPEPWRLGELGLWLWRAGALDSSRLEGMALPYRLEIGGDWQGAADDLAADRLPLRGGAGPRPWRPAGAAAGARHPDRAGRGPGGRDGPAQAARRGCPRHSARPACRDPAQPARSDRRGRSDILRLLAEDLSNKEIAARLRIAPKTVDHHVCAILAKLEVATRKQAARHPVTRALARQT